MTSARRLRVVVFTCGPLGFQAARELRGAPGVGEVTIIFAPYRSPRRRGVDRIRHLLRYNGPGRLLIDAAGRLLDRNGKRLQDGYIPPVEKNSLRFDDFHSEECVEAVRALEADLGVVVGTHILQRSIFALPRLGSINLHTGMAPQYRGAAPAFWEMYNGEARVGITVHRVAEQVDAGVILNQQSFPFDSAPSGDPLKYIERYRSQVLHPNGIRMLVETVSAIAGGTVVEQPQDEGRARTYRTPDRRTIAELKRRVARRRRSHATRRVKAFLGWLVFSSGYYRRVFRGRAPVVLFHRVDDEYAGNPISCTTREFDRYCAFFARYFEVVSLSALAEAVQRGDDLSGKLAITFDDGYSDNVSAAATLKAYGLNACFFVATGYIGTARDGWWDLEQGCRSRWMSWTDVAQLHEWGFELGAHTENHVDLGRIEGVAARREIEGSRTALEQVTGRPVQHFSYPYGGRNHITHANRQLISDLGFTTCSSAYGGWVTRDSDLMDVQRFAVSPWHISPWQLGYELMFEPAPKLPAS